MSSCIALKWLPERLLKENHDNLIVLKKCILTLTKEMLVRGWNYKHVRAVASKRQDKALVSFWFSVATTKVIGDCGHCESNRWLPSPTCTRDGNGKSCSLCIFRPTIWKYACMRYIFFLWGMPPDLPWYFASSITKVWLRSYMCMHHDWIFLHSARPCKVNRKMKECCKEDLQGNVLLCCHGGNPRLF